MRLILAMLFFGVSLTAQDPIAAIPQGNGAWAFYPDGTAALVELNDGKLVVRQMITTSPQVLHAEWIDRTNTKHQVDTDCRNITLAECLKRHLDAVAAYQAAFPPQ
jgi:hypothetical protein